MSLKNIIRKTIASLSAISIVFGNCSLCGIGLVQVIAENEIVPAIRAELLNEQYIQYKYEKAMEGVETVEEVVQEIAEGEKQDEQDVEEINENQNENENKNIVKESFVNDTNKLVYKIGDLRYESLLDRLDNIEYKK